VDSALCTSAAAAGMLSISAMIDCTLSVGSPLIGYQCTSAQLMSAASADRIVLFHCW
jgi:hypothetical protein